MLKAQWKEINHDEAVWTVPLASLKDRKHRKEPFRVPLSARAIEIAKDMEKGHVSAFIFPGHIRNRPLSNMALLTLLKRMNAGEPKAWIDPTGGRPITAHGHRIRRSSRLPYAWRSGARSSNPSSVRRTKST